MKGSKNSVCCLLLITVVLTQTAAVALQTDGVSNPWLSRARSLTDELVKDADALSRYDRALLLARLGKVWQRDDAELAREWIEKALQAMESSPDKEDATERVQRLSTARSLLVILGAQEKALSARLNKVINAAADTRTPFGGSENAKAKAEAGLAVLDSDPQRALQFGLASLRAGGSYRLASLIWRLRKRDVKLSDTLFMEVLATARANNYDRDLLAILPAVAFEGPSPSDKLRGSFLGVLADGLLRVPGSAEEQSAPCLLAFLAAPLLPEFQRLIPQQAGMVRAQIATCQPTLNSEARKEVGDALQDHPLNTVDALLEEAGKTSGLERRVMYLNRAAYIAFSEQKYERAINILDGYSSEERESANKPAGGLWESQRIEFASAAAVAHLRRSDRPAMHRIIADTPAHLRAYVQMSVAAELVKKDGPAATQLLNEARTAIAKTGSPQDFGSYLLLVRLYAALNQPDALPALGDAIKAMNQAERSPRGGSPADEVEAQMPLLSNNLMLGRYALPVSLLELDDVGVRQTLASVDSPTRRAAIRLNLLGASLERHRASTPKPATEPKGQNNANR